MLRRKFGYTDVQGHAAQTIDTLKMTEEGTFQQHLVKFDAQAVLLDWGDAALAHHLYMSLPNHIQDDIVFV